jgi:hypothetical protein
MRIGFITICCLVWSQNLVFYSERTCTEIQNRELKTNRDDVRNEWRELLNGRNKNWVGLIYFRTTSSGEILR